MQEGARDFDISVVVCTFNRGAMLRPALESLASQTTDSSRFEVILVDNNSTDDTRDIIDEFIGGRENWFYVFEPRQGLSYARNTGVAHARAPIVAFTDDDVRVAPDWLAQIERSLEEHPEVDFVGGKVHPRWGSRPPAWLTKVHWIPLAIVDHGDDAFHVDSAKPWCMVGANLAVRRQVLLDSGGFSPAFQRVKNVVGSTEDHEFQRRLWKSGRRGLYAPTVVVEAEVQDDRLEKAYHRRWHAGHGRFCAMMGTERISEDMPELFGVPACFIRDILTHAAAWSQNKCMGQEDVAFLHESKIRFLVSYLRTYRGMLPESRRSAVLSRTLHGMRELTRRKVHSM
ncbi:MAG TPA: glycosyltransferase [Gemmatimonadaceae bacterium]|nr:glycosyltransferase [Gemmatimonadaceae bacterium]